MFSLHLLRSFYVLICCAPERRNLNAAERDWARNHSILRWGSLAKMIGRQPWLNQAECKTYEARCWLDGSVGGTTCDVWSISKVNFHARRHRPTAASTARSVSTCVCVNKVRVETKTDAHTKSAEWIFTLLPARWERRAPKNLAKLARGPNRIRLRPNTN